ncbi:hypothetical protein ABI59_02745 [Acidobacteria bacterium Mor1]|nr:hypothetical protein ABI59_02745 [Acidobacteria bacterium Mor1]
MRAYLVGYGKMGRAIETILLERGHTVAGRLERGEALEIDPAAVDVAFEFTEPSQSEANVEALVRAGLRVVCGTTGWSPGRGLRQSVERAGVGAVIAPNFSLGMNLFYRVLDSAMDVLGGIELYDPYIHEMHHRGKKDAPSGTAHELARRVAARHGGGAEAHPGAAATGLPAGSFHVSATRAGYEPGTHTVGFDGEHDHITLTHQARSRSVFALGAVLAGEWILGRTGVHDFTPVIDALIERGQARLGGNGGG